MLPRVAILVLNFNGKIFLKECLSSIADQSYPHFDVFFVDNNSSDGSVEFVEDQFPLIRIIRLEENYGFAEGYNRATRVIKYPFVVFVNNDVVVERGWLNELVKAIVPDENIAACGSKVMFDRARDTINSAGGKFTLLGVGYDIAFGAKDVLKETTTKPVAYVNGCSMIVRREIFLQTGGFDEDYFAYLEEMDFCWNAWLRGYRILYVPSSVVYHKLGGTSGSGYFSPSKVFLIQRNRLSTIIKRFQFRYLILAATLSLVYDLFRMVYVFPQCKEPAECVKSVMRGYVFVAFRLRCILTKRKLSSSLRKLPDAFLMKSGMLASLPESIAHFRRTLNLKFDL